MFVAASTSVAADEVAAAGTPVTDSPVEAVVERLRVRNGLSTQEVMERMDSQMGRSDRLARADAVIDNTSGVADLKRTVNGLWNSRVKERAAEE